VTSNCKTVEWSPVATRLAVWADDVRRVLSLSKVGYRLRSYHPQRNLGESLHFHKVTKQDCGLGVFGGRE
jgi:hypothetical protein